MEETGLSLSCCFGFRTGFTSIIELFFLSFVFFLFKIITTFSSFSGGIFICGRLGPSEVQMSFSFAKLLFQPGGAISSLLLGSGISLCQLRPALALQAFPESCGTFHKACGPYSETDLVPLLISQLLLELIRDVRFPVNM